jgi:cytidylate kinase
MLVFINGSLNSGKSSTSRLLAQKLGAEFIDFDEFSRKIPNFQLSKDIPEVLRLGSDAINKLDKEGKSVVANYVLSQKDYEILTSNLDVAEQHFFTLSPRIEVARSNKGRELSEWEYERVKHHYDIGINKPSFGEIIDNSDISLEDTVNLIISKI